MSANSTKSYFFKILNLNDRQARWKLNSAVFVKQCRLEKPFLRHVHGIKIILRYKISVVVLLVRRREHNNFRMRKKSILETLQV